MKKIKAFLAVFVFVLGNLSQGPLYAAEKPKETELYSLSAAMIDGDSGRVLYEKNGDEQRAMASTTKIMTLILALEYSNGDDLVTVSSYAAKMPDVQLGINAGEQYRLSDLYYSLMLESHNDTAVAIAEHVGGSVENFAKMMNDKAHELGLSQTYFITPNGLDDEDENGVHSTTACELALIMKYCVMDSPKREEFIQICQTRSHRFSDYTGKRSFSVSNKNSFLDMMDGVIAGKTGFTGSAGYCYVCALERDGKTYIVALLGCGWPGNKSYKWSDTRKLLEYGIEQYQYQKILDASYETGYIRVEKGIGKEAVSTYISGEVNLLVSEEDQITFDVNFPGFLEAPVLEGEIVGELNIYVNDILYCTKNVYAGESVERINYKYYLKQAIQSFLF